MNTLKLITLSGVLVLLVACDSDEVAEKLETANFVSDFYKNDYQLLNATDYELDYHIANVKLNGDERDVADQEYYIATLVTGSQSQNIEHESNALRELSVYVVARNVYVPDIQNKVEVSKDKNYNLLAWQQGEQLKLNMFKQKRDNKANALAIRVFATQTIDVKFNNKQFILDAGELSAFNFTEHCVDGLTVEGQKVDLCDLSFGRSYLLVAGKSGKQFIFNEG